MTIGAIGATLSGDGVFDPYPAENAEAEYHAAGKHRSQSEVDGVGTTTGKSSQRLKPMVNSARFWFPGLRPLPIKSQSISLPAWILLGLIVFGICSCTRDKKSVEWLEYGKKLAEADMAYCSKDIDVAKRCLLKCRLELLEKKHYGEPGYLYDSELCRTSGRLFLIYEHLGETNKSEVFFRESVKYYNKYLLLHGSHEVPNMTTDELRQYLARRDKNIRIGWLGN